MHNLPAFPGADEHDVFKAWSTDWKRLAPVWAIIQLSWVRRTWPALTGPILEVILYTRQGHFFEDTTDWLDEVEYCLLRIQNENGETENVHLMRGLY